MFDPDALHEARKREGAAADDRPEDVAEVMAPREMVGWQTEAPLLDCEYDDYPAGEELYRPAMRGTLRTLLEHDKVRGAEDIADELATDVETVIKAASLHDIDLPDGSDFDVDVHVPRLRALLGAEWPDELVRPDNAVTVATLYVEKGLSVEEIADVLAEVMDRSIPERFVRQTLVDARILGGQTTDEQEARMRQNRGRGLTISVD